MLWDMTRDIRETKNVAQDHTEIVMQIETYLKTARVETPNWPDDMLRNK